MFRCDDQCVYLTWLVSCLTIVLHLYLARLYIQRKRFSQDHIRIDDQVIIVTGAHSGIGFETALELARRGGRIYLGCRDHIKGCTTRRRIVLATGNNQVYHYVLDLSSVRSIRRFVSDFLSTEYRLDVLINNAAVMCLPERKLTRDGLEMHFGINHLGHFLLTRLLVETLKDSHPSRIVNLTSYDHHRGVLDPLDLQCENRYSRFDAYNNSKLANVLFTRELARRLTGTGVTANSVNPGPCQTNLHRHLRVLVIILYPIYALFFKAPSAGAQTSVAVAIDPQLEKVSGKYFSDCSVGEESILAKSNTTAAWLWEKSEKLLQEISDRIRQADRRRY